ncbi:MAG: hypothetical protein KJ977_05485 [Candidatus Omnitrophica bacterium]|nr:hypothetical protein [Candidatus Omnitrophota bacterium]
MATLVGKYGSPERNKQVKESGLNILDYKGTKAQNLQIMKYLPTRATAVPAPVATVTPAPTTAKPILPPKGIHPLLQLPVPAISLVTLPGIKPPKSATAATPPSYVQAATAATPRPYFQTALDSLAKLSQKAKSTWKGIPSHIKTGVIAPLALGGIAAAYANKNPDVSSGIVTGMGNYYDMKIAEQKRLAEEKASQDRLRAEYGMKATIAGNLLTAEQLKEGRLAAAALKEKTTEKAMEAVNELVKGGQLPSDEMLIAAGAFGDKERYRNIAKNNAKLINRNIHAPYYAPVKSEPTDDELLLKEYKQAWANFIKKYDTMEKQQLALSGMSVDEATQINEIYARLYNKPLFTTTETIIEGKPPNIFSWAGTPEKTETKVTMVLPQVEKTTIGKVPAKKKEQPLQKVQKVKVPFVPNIKYYTDKQGRKAVTLSQNEYDKHEKEIDDYTTVYINGIAYTHRKE